ncbi:MAG: hypothetical protein GY863_08700 [bacterium]|nr:hypothetical protein [bacterium]
MQRGFYLFTLLCLVITGVLHAQEKESDLPVLKGSYLGQNPPGIEPEIFAPEVLNINLHTSPLFSPDLKEVYWRAMEGTEQITVMKMKDDIWTAPRDVPFSMPSGTDSPEFSSDGEKLYFITIDTKNNDRDIIMSVTRQNKTWTEPEKLDDAINSHLLHWQFSLAANGSLYFTSRNEGVRGLEDIYCSELINGKYTEPRDLGSPINSDYQESTPFIAPDESYIIFTRLGKERRYGDLYISFRKKDGSWSASINMGTSINSDRHELCPRVSPDGKYLFFLSHRTGMSRAYWVDAKIIEELKPDYVK